MTLTPHPAISTFLPVPAMAWGFLLGALLLAGAGCEPMSPPSDASSDQVTTADPPAQPESPAHVPQLVTNPELLTPQQAAALEQFPTQQPLGDPPPPEEAMPVGGAASPEDLMAEVLAELAQEDAEAEALAGIDEAAELSTQDMDNNAGVSAEEAVEAVEDTAEAEAAADADATLDSNDDETPAEAPEDTGLDNDALIAQLESLLAAREDDVTQLREEVGAMREELRQLGESLDIYLGAIMADLREENQVLRQEMRRLYAREADGAPISLTDVPRPYGEMLDDIVYQEASDFSADNDATAMTEAEAAPPPFRFDVLEEWGRSPEDAQASNIASLKGIIGVIPAGSTREDIEDLARELRTEYDNHDNINIEIFDHPEAAQQFSERGATDPNHRIISISKYAASGRDVILYFEGGEPTVLEGEGAETESLSEEEIEAILAEDTEAS